MRRLTWLLAALLALSVHLVAPQSARAVGPFSFNWTGTPLAPQPWHPGAVNDWQLSVHDRDLSATFYDPYSFQAQHGSDCSGFEDAQGNPRIPAGQHTVGHYADEAFICNNHMMTGLEGDGYGEITFTPAQLVDWSAGSASIRWRQSTRRTSCRDWLSFNLMPFADNLQLTDGSGVDLYGEARNEVVLDSGPSCNTGFPARVYRNFAATQTIAALADPLAYVPQSSNLRTAFEIDVSSTHLKFWLPELNRVLTEGDFATPLAFTRAVFQFAHHSYDPVKECTPNPLTCSANTWHWSDVAISSAVPMTILNGDQFQITDPTYGPYTDTVRFAQPTPANAYLRMEALAAPGTMTVTTNAGQILAVNQQQPSELNHAGTWTDGQMNLVWMPIPAGVTSLRFQARDPFWTGWLARNIAVWSQ